MKLSEVIKAIEDGSKSEFKTFNFKLSARNYQTINSAVFLESSIMPTNIFLLPLDGWEEVKPPRQWSEKELMLFKLLPDWVKWISRYGNETILATNLKPSEPNIGEYLFLNIQAFDFLTITFEESPVYIGDLKGE